MKSGWPAKTTPRPLRSQICTTNRKITFEALNLSCKCHALTKHSCNSKSASVMTYFCTRNRFSHTPTLFQNRSLVLEKSYSRDPVLQSCSADARHLQIWGLLSTSNPCVDLDCQTVFQFEISGAGHSPDLETTAWYYGKLVKSGWPTKTTPRPLRSQICTTITFEAINLSCKCRAVRN